MRIGDRVEIAMPLGRRRSLIVRGLAERSLPRSVARTLYEDVTPPPSPEALEARRLEGLYAPRRDAGRPDKRTRRERIRDKRG